MNAICFFGAVLLLGFVLNDVAGKVNKLFQDGGEVDEEVSENLIIPDSSIKDDACKPPDFFPGRNSFECIPLKDFEKTLHRASLLEKGVMFQDLNPFQRELARPLFQILMRIRKENLIDAFDIAKPYLNNLLHLYVTRSVTAHRNDTKEEIIASHVTLAPHLYFDLGGLAMSILLGNASKTLYLSGKVHDDDPRSRDEEYRLSYFRLDPGVNTHHERWHISHLDSEGYTGDWSVDRSGEIFYYMHSQMIRRYNFGRVNADVPFVLPFHDLRDPIPEPYFENLQTMDRERFWDSRSQNQVIKDIDVRGLAINVQDLEVWRDRIYDAIDRGHVYRLEGDNEIVELLNGPKNLSEATPGVPFDVGIDKLADMVWGHEKRSVNFKYYGNLHNQGHALLGNVHDPQGIYHRQSRAMAMSATSTATRDPLFYRWHKFVDDIFERYKATLPPYTQEELKFSNISISDFKIASCGRYTNTIRTRWVRDRVNITEGIKDAATKDIFQVDEVFYDFVHLAHDDFDYHIKVTNNLQKPVKGTVRIFMAPVYDDWKVQEQMATMDSAEAAEMRKINTKSEPVFNKYRKLFIELDKFVVDIAAKQCTTWIVQSSKASSITVPFENLFMTSEKAEGNKVLAWKGCGWPNYLLVGKGNETGFPVQIFVMISDYEKDKVSNDTNERSDDPDEPHGSLSNCGVPDRKYPDRKPMGYPFDRNAPSGDLIYLHHFMSKNRDPKDTPEMITDKYENMKVIDMKIQHFPGDAVNGSTINHKYNACDL